MQTRVDVMDDKLYEVISGWWAKHGWPAIPKTTLPNRSYVSTVDDYPVFAGFIYKDESSDFGMFEWAVSNPDASPQQKAAGFHALIEKVKSEASACGIKHLITSTNSPGLEKRLKFEGFEGTDDQVKFLMVNL